MATSANPLAAGTTVGNYAVHRLISEGGSAMVYEASHLILPRRVALKVMHEHLITNAQSAQRILQEACLLEAFSHPGAVRVYECGVLADRRPWIAMELVGGEPLSTMLARTGPLEVRTIVTMMASIIDVVGAAHRSGIVHRDLKPDNVLVTGAALESLRVIDWGIARQPLPTKLTLENFTLGTPTYMAPEQARGHAIDGRADVYALGVMAYEAATGRPPFQADNPIELVVMHISEPPEPVRSLRADLPPGLAWLIDSMLEKDPAARPSAKQVGQRLDRLAQQLDEQVVPPVEDYDEYAELTITREVQHEIAQEAADDDDGSYEVVIDLDSAVSLSGDADPTLDAFIDELEREQARVAAAAAAEAARTAENQRTRRRNLSVRWTPTHLVAAVTAYCDEPRTPGTLVVPRTQGDAVSGEVDC